MAQERLVVTITISNNNANHDAAFVSELEAAAPGADNWKIVHIEAIPAGQSKVSYRVFLERTV